MSYIGRFTRILAKADQDMDMVGKSVSWNSPFNPSVMAWNIRWFPKK